MLPSIPKQYREELLSYKHDIMPNIMSDQFIGECH